MSTEAPSWPPEFAERYRAAGYWTGETFGEFLAARAETFADRVAIVDGSRRWTYAELLRRADAMAADLHRRGVRKGDRVVVQLPNIAEYFQAVFGLFRLGALPVFALPAHRKAEIGYFCEHTEAAAYLHPGEFDGFDYRGLAAEVPVPRAIEVAEGHPWSVGCTEGGLHDAQRTEGGLQPPEAGEVAFLQLSGGSTGVPKLIPRTHDDYLYSVRASAEICRLTPDSVYLVALPAAHNFPMSSPGSLGVLHAGGTLVLARKPVPELVFELIESEGVTITAAVPPLALAWLDAARHTDRDLSSLDILQVGGAKFSAEAAKRVGPELGCRLQQVFGMAEGLVNYTRLDDPDELVVNTQGRPISPDDELRVVDDQDNPVPQGETGHLLTRGPYTIRGYYRAAEHNAKAFTEDGFYRTGDLVRLTPEGYLVVEGRAKDQINRGGEKIAAEEVENHLLAHESVHDVAVVSVPDKYLGERTCAVVVPRPDQPKLKLSAVKGFLRQRGLADYKLPDRLELVDRFPQTGVGKVSKVELRATLSRALAEQAARKGS